MIHVIIGPKGTGKTKAFIEKVNSASNGAEGNVVCIEKGNRLMFDLNRNIRMIDINDFTITNESDFFAFISGIISQDFDTTDIFIESLNKILSDMNQYEVFINNLETLAKKFNINFTITISADESEIPDGIKKYIV